MKNKIVWYLRQFLPLTYCTTYGEGGNRFFCVWRMWFGRSFDVQTVQIAE